MSDEVSIKVGGQSISGWTGVTIEQAIDNCADAFSISAPFDPDRKDLRERFKPFGYQPCEVYIGDDLIITGRIEKVEPSQSETEQMITVQGRNKTGVLVDCYIDEVGYQYDGYALSTVIIQITKKYGIEVWAENDTDPIPECAAEPGQKIFDFLAKLSESFGLFLSSNEKGWLVLSYPPKAAEIPVASIVAGQSPYIGGSASYDGSIRFSRYKIIASNYGAKPQADVADDPMKDIHGELIYRHSVEAIEGTVPKKKKTTAEHKRALALARSASINVTVSGWRDGNGALWKKGSTITLLAPALMVYTETAFVVAGVTLKIDESDGRIADLRLVLPQTYADKMPEVYPWD